MAVSYMYLWYIFIERNIGKKKLAEKAGITQYTTKKLDKNESVGTETIGKIRCVLDCTTDNIIKFRQLS